MSSIDLKRQNDRERSRGWHEARRARNVCEASTLTHPCKRVPEINPRTGRPFWKCREHRRRRA